jgi:hypothetical protein
MGEVSTIRTALAEHGQCFAGGVQSLNESINVQPQNHYSRPIGTANTHEIPHAASMRIATRNTAITEESLRFGEHVRRVAKLAQCDHVTGHADC